MPKTKFAARLLALASVILLSLSGCGGGSGDSGTTPPPQTQAGIVSGQIADAQTGAPLVGVEVKIGALKASSDVNGKYVVTGVPVGAEVVAQFSKAQYASNFATVEVNNVRTSVANRQLAKVAVRQELSAATGGTVSLAGSAAQVQLPAAGLVNAATGAPFSGTVVVEMTPVDPGQSPNLMPGNYRAQGEALPIESMGALQVELRDGAGALLNLAPGKTATIRIPVPAGAASPPLTIPLFYFKEATGLWVREGMATLTGNPPQQYYEGQVSHFTFWNADQTADTIYINGCVVNASGLPLDATVSATGIDYFGSARAQTSADGKFRVAARRNSQVEVRADSADDFASVAVTTGSTDLTLPACLVIAAKVPVIVTQPVGLTLASGSFGGLSVVANSANRYQWYRNGALVAGGSAFLPIFGSASVAGSYYVVVSNSHGSVTSATVTVTVAAPVVAPIIVSQPQDMSVLVGGNPRFAVLAQGDSISYQWLRNGVEIAAARGPVLVLAAASQGDHGAKFSCRVSNSAGTVVSDAATLNVTSELLAAGIAQQPANASVQVGQSASFAVLASGSAPLSYQWMLNGVAIENAVAATYQTPVATMADNGAKYTVRVSNAKGSATSNQASLTVSPLTGVAGLHLSFPYGTKINGLFGYAAIPEAGGTVVPLFGAGQGDLAEFLMQGQRNNGVVSNAHVRNLLYWKNQQLFRRDLIGTNGLPAEVRVSSVSELGLCNKGLTGSTDFVSSGIDFVDSNRSWKIVQKQGTDAICNTDDDRFFAVKASMGAADAPVEVLRPVASLHTAQGALSGWVLRNGLQLQRVNAEFANPVTLLTLPAAELNFVDLSDLDNHWLFATDTGLYSVDLDSAAPAAITQVATLAAGENVLNVFYSNTDAFIAIGNVTATRVVRFSTASKVSTVLGTVSGYSNISHVTPTRVILPGPLGSMRALPLAGGPVQVVYEPSVPSFSFMTLRGGERLWLSVQDSVVSFNSDGSGVQTLPNAKLAGCLLKNNAILEGTIQVCDAVLVIQGNVVRSFDAQTGAVRINYGTVTLPAAPMTSVFSFGMVTAWGQPGVLSQFILHPTDSNQQAIVNYLIKTDQVGVTPIALP
jgi:hypothetical protein